MFLKQLQIVMAKENFTLLICKRIGICAVPVTIVIILTLEI